MTLDQAAPSGGAAAESPSPPVIEAADLTRIYRRGSEEIRALDRVSLMAHRGDFIAIVGPSGSGKTTLLNLLGCLDLPSSGLLRLDGEDVAGLSEGALTRVRRERIGFVFQHFGLLPTLTVAENVGLPALLSRRAAAGRVTELLAAVGLEHRRHHRPHELSGGEMQRTAIARALMNRPSLLLCDEPTGNLDSAAGEMVYSLLRDLNSSGEQTIIVVTHNRELAAHAARSIRLVDGRVAEGDPAS